MPQTTGIIHIFVSLLHKVYMNLHMEKLHMGQTNIFTTMAELTLPDECFTLLVLTCTLLMMQLSETHRD